MYAYYNNTVLLFHVLSHGFATNNCHEFASVDVIAVERKIFLKFLPHFLTVFFAKFFSHKYLALYSVLLHYSVLCTTVDMYVQVGSTVLFLCRR